VRSTFVDPLRIRVIPLSSTEQSWIAEIDHHTAGCVSLGDAGTGIAELRLVVVEFEYRGLGLGRRLVHEALAFADRMRYRAVQIRLDGAAPGAASWLTSLGFVAEECASSGEGPSGGGLPSSVQYRIDLASA
jgi:N-acetylglutamate synthase-like GNAT family acetyltransferase